MCQAIFVASLDRARASPEQTHRPAQHAFAAERPAISPASAACPQLLREIATAHDLANPSPTLQPPAIAVDDPAPARHSSDKFDALLLYNCRNFEFCNEEVAGRVRGRLKEHVDFWRSIGASQFVIKIITEGYYLPFVSQPPIYHACNHRSALSHAEFVSAAVKDLMACGSAIRMNKEDLVMCSPLGVVEGRKLRLILDLRELNKHIDSPRFKYDDIKVACTLFSVGDHFFSFDLKSAYHHIDMDPDYYKYLGFEWAGHYYAFASLPFGLCSAPYVFSKVCRALVKHWRARGYKLFMYLDDGAGAAGSRLECASMSAAVHDELLRSGFLLSQKSRFDPMQCGELLGFVLDLKKGEISVAPRRVEKLHALLHSVCTKPRVSARLVAKLTGTIISMGQALGPVARLRTRALYEVINSVPDIDDSVRLSPDATCEIRFWRESFSSFVGVPLRPLAPITMVVTWSDASDFAWGGYVICDGHKQVARGGWPEEVRDSSSTFRELRATFLVLESLAPTLSLCTVIHRTDNQAAAQILSTGSAKQHLHDEAVRVFQLCLAWGIRLHVEWVPREMNEVADFLSKLQDEDDWQLNPNLFTMIDRIFGPHTVDRFASSATTQLPRYCSRWLNPGSECIDSFTADWSGECNWLCPPIHLIPRVIRHVLSTRSDGSLLMPFWKSSLWWPLVCAGELWFQSFVIDCMVLEPHAGMFLAGTCRWNLFNASCPKWRVLVLKLCGCGVHRPGHRTPVPC